jgi:hypothetical protein
MVVLASLFECMARFKIVSKSPNHLIITSDLTFAAKMSCCRSERLNLRSLSPVSAGCGHGHGHGHGGGHTAAHVALYLEEEAPPTGEQHVEEGIVEEPRGA